MGVVEGLLKKKHNMINRLILHKSTNVIFRVTTQNYEPKENEDALDTDGSFSIAPEGSTKYWTLDPTVGKRPATIREIIESGIGDADRTQARINLIAAMDAMKADALVRGSVKDFVTTLRAYFDYSL